MNIKCPHCGYDGSDPKVGWKMVSVDYIGIPKVICSKCKKEFKLPYELKMEIGK